MLDESETPDGEVVNSAASASPPKGLGTHLRHMAQLVPFEDAGEFAMGAVGVLGSEVTNPDGINVAEFAGSRRG